MPHELDETRAVFGSAKEIAQDRLLVFLGRLPDRAGDLDLVHPDGRHVDRNGGVDASVSEDRVHGASIILEAPLWGQVDRVVKRRLGGSPALHVRLGRRFGPRAPDPRASGLVDAHAPRPSGARDEGAAVPSRDRLQREGHRQVEELLDRVGSKDAGLGEHRLCREVRAPEGTRVGHGRPASGLRAARLYRDDGLVLRCLARDPDEVPRVAEVLDVREDQFRVPVSVPHPKEIVEAHLGLVPQRAELREADAQGFRVVQDGDAEGAALCGQRDPARERRRRRERRIHADVGVGVDHAHAVRADHRHVVRVAHREESRLAGHSDLPDFSEAGGDHDEPFHSLLPAVLDGFECDLCGYRDDREIHSVGDLEDARIRPDPVDARHLRVHRVDRPLVIVHDEIVEDFVADLSSMRSVAVVLVLLGSVGAVLLVTAPTASATVYFRGIISVPTTWGGGAETNYVATGPITIRPSGSLTIMPGTIVRFEPGVHLFVEGRLTPDGPSAKAITSPANNTASPFPWGGIQFNASSSGSISWSTFDRVDRALTATDSSPDVTRNTVLQAGAGFAFVRSSSFSYSNTTQHATHVRAYANASY